MWDNNHPPHAPQSDVMFFPSEAEAQAVAETFIGWNRVLVHHWLGGTGQWFISCEGGTYRTDGTVRHSRRRN